MVLACFLLTLKQLNETTSAETNNTAESTKDVAASAGPASPNGDSVVKTSDFFPANPAGLYANNNEKRAG